MFKRFWFGSSLYAHGPVLVSAMRYWQLVGSSLEPAGISLSTWSCFKKLLIFWGSLVASYLTCCSRRHLFLWTTFKSLKLLAPFWLYTVFRVFPKGSTGGWPTATNDSSSCFEARLEWEASGSEWSGPRTKLLSCWVDAMFSKMGRFPVEASIGEPLPSLI